MTGARGRRLRRGASAAVATSVLLVVLPAASEAAAPSRAPTPVRATTAIFADGFRIERVIDVLPWQHIIVLRPGQ